MALTITAACANAMADAATALVDATAAGTLQISTTEDDYVGAELLSEITLLTTAYGAASGGVCTLDVTGGLSDVSAAGTGTAAFGRVIDGAGTEIFKGTVGTSGTDFIIDNTSIITGQTVNLISGSFTMPLT